MKARLISLSTMLVTLVAILAPIAEAGGRNGG